MSAAEQLFGRVAPMLERERQAANAKATASGLPYRVMSLSVGRPEAQSSHATEQEALDELARVHSTCAPFIRSAIWAEGPNGRLR